ncbi:pyridoxamine 5'-phosphate oxidase family protein [Rhabdothermincola salaria]|uniref:pyridoxamine 5'-phosphate oxidase family protein n=1 Tax=Rhabdothermincola salaria TaxID=2903142 RepID=UPI001E62D163|nr:pyridoxamine 5'-phosphate oxidase family protein [Rhabdothermincola salaria]MCD9625340.1 pyridoxamine 5'-phosphate oxidase family protein [Rhabdothermincola salaria]
MARLHDAIDQTLRDWIAAQHVFFVATAPSGPDGHVNLSPKGYDTFRVLDDHTVAYLDLTGSGVETIAHLRDNARITFMFCAFEGKPQILRLFGRGEAVLPEDGRFADLAAAFPAVPGVRAVVRCEVDRVQTSCGFAVPFMAYESERETLSDWAARKGPDGIDTYQADKNARSIDGLPGMVP